MRVAVQLCVLIAFAVALSGQAINPATTKPRQPTGTRIGPHRLGESFNEWLAIEKIDLDSICQDHEQHFTAEAPSSPPPPHADPGRDDFYEQLRAVAVWESDKRDKEQAAILRNLAEFQRHSEAEFLCTDLRDIKDTGNGDYRDFRGLSIEGRIKALQNNDYVDRWTFVNRKLALKQSIYSTEITAKELGFLKEAYGPPALVTKVPQQNAFGAKWNDVLVTWHLPGGTTLYMKALGGPKDDLIVTFISKEYSNAPASREPNPYLSTQP
jgi:hypothetical protein